MEPVYCPFCEQNRGRRVVATCIGAQSTDGGKTVGWVPICDDHADGWNEGGDWWAPVFRLGARVG